MSQLIRRVQIQCLVLVVAGVLTVAPSSATGQTPSRLRSAERSTDSNAGTVSYVPKPDEQLLRQKNIAESTPQLWQFLADPKLPPWEVPLEEWLKPFRKTWNGYRDRYRVLQRLEAKGLDGDKWPYLGTNDKGCYAHQPEFVTDVKEVLVREHERSKPRVVEAAIRLLANRNPDGFTKKLIRLAPSLVQLDRRVEETLIESLAEASMPGGKADPSLLAATKSPVPIVRAVAIRSLLRSGGMHADAAAALFADEDLTVKWQIAMGLIDRKNKAAIPTLIDLIPQVSGDQASHLEKLLHHIAGNGPELALGGDKETRLKAHQSWKLWWKERANRVTSSQISHGITLAYNDTHVVELNVSGEILWELEIRPTLRSYPTCAQRLANGNILIGESSTSTFETGFVPNGRLLELTRTGAVIWERRVGRARTFERLSDGRTLIGGNILDVKGNRRQLLPPGSCYHVRSNPEGGFVFTRHGETTVQGYPSAVNDGPCYRKLTEVDDDGTVTRVTRVRDEVTFGSSNWYFEFMENGHLLVCRANDVMELDKDRKPVKIFAKGEFIERVQRLENGNFLISIHGCGKSKVEEYTRDGKKIGTMRLPKGLHFVSRR
jgi:hypothetical protein